MNYRHAYHAGNFADVLKHVVLALRDRIHEVQGAPFRVIDVHAGAGRYALDLDGGRKDRRMAGRHRSAARARMQGRYRQMRGGFCNPTCRLARGANAGARLAVYPGSPAIALPTDARSTTP